MRFPAARAAAMADSAIPKAGMLCSDRKRSSPGSEKHATTNADAFCSRARASMGPTAVLTSSSVSMAAGPPVEVMTVHSPPTASRIWSLIRSELLGLMTTTCSLMIPPGPR